MTSTELLIYFVTCLITGGLFGFSANCFFKAITAKDEVFAIISGVATVFTSILIITLLSVPFIHP